MWHYAHPARGSSHISRYASAQQTRPRRPARAAVVAPACRAAPCPRRGSAPTLRAELEGGAPLPTTQAAGCLTAQWRPTRTGRSSRAPRASAPSPAEGSPRAPRRGPTRCLRLSRTHARDAGSAPLPRPQGARRPLPLLNCTVQRAAWACPPLRALHLSRAASAGPALLFARPRAHFDRTEVCARVEANAQISRLCPFLGARRSLSLQHLGPFPRFARRVGASADEGARTSPGLARLGPR